MSYRILGVTGCPTGIAHTFMAQEALEKAAGEKDISIKVETHGQQGVENSFTPEEIRKAEVIIVAADKNVDIERFNGKKLINVSVSKGIKQADALIDRALSGDVSTYRTDRKYEGPSGASEEKVSIWRQIYVHLMNGVSHMIPFVVAGGVMIAISFMFGIYSADPSSDQYNPIAAQMNTIGGVAMGLMVPILSAFIAQSIANRPGMIIGFITGLIAADNGTGFLGGIVSGFLSGLVMVMLARSLRGLPKQLDGLKSIFLYPVLGIFIAGFIIWYLSIPMEMINQTMMDFISGFQYSSPIILGLLIGSMSAFDMGGPVNKAAYVTGTVLLAEGNYLFMAGVSAACIAPPLATGFAVLFGRKYYSADERSAGLVNFLLGSTHITEGAIPFAAKRPLTIIPILMIGSSIAAILTYLFQVEVPAPHGGFIVLPIVTHALLWILAILLGSVVAGYLMSLDQKRAVDRLAVADGAVVSADDMASNVKLDEETLKFGTDQVHLDHQLKDKQEALEFIAATAVEDGISTDRSAVLQGLLDREAQSSTGMENGIAIPHVSDASIKTPSLIVIRNRQGIDWPAMDGEETNFIISILVPEGAGDKHLKILADISRKLVHESVIERLHASNSKAEIKDILLGEQ
ncbi:fructose-specific PTS transporter subunit EIIC [Salinicoccus hispanicus]|uniref:PTS transporter subunit EIIA n=1 Tax=Salinicoccus hispanicus TaxID=157225 RepID=A0A6N8TZQ4_9STAP|nr:fructose-specific PTS transporter subunit EIIC [Salinicoccus hispanicus]MXQ51290.1 PTS transporter subunit EIIA [Salinicoccus hispanicus]